MVLNNDLDNELVTVLRTTTFVRRPGSSYNDGETMLIWRVSVNETGKVLILTAKIAGFNDASNFYLALTVIPGEQVTITTDGNSLKSVELVEERS